MTRGRKPPPVFLDNPWGFSERDCKIIWLLHVLPSKQITQRVGLSEGGISMVLTRAYSKMGVSFAAAAAVEFDRWWQSSKRNFPDAVVQLFEDELLKGLV